MRKWVQTLSQSLNIVIYARNLVFIWKERGTLTPAINRTVHVVVALVAVIALIVVAYTWLNEYQEIHTKSSGAGRAWF